jgi:hypothetical protein
VLTDLRTKLVGGCNESLTSTSSTSLSSGYDTACLSSDASLSSAASCQTPGASSFNRRNNLQLQLSTIIDDDSLNSSLQKQQQQQTGLKTSGQLVSPNVSASTSPTLIANLQQQCHSSSRESSPEYSNSNSKVASRDSSPGLNYRKQLGVGLWLEKNLKTRKSFV